MKLFTKEIIFLGAGGHASVLFEMIDLMDIKLKEIFVDKNDLDKPSRYHERLKHGDEIWQNYNSSKYKIIVGVGRKNIYDQTRNKLYKIVLSLGFESPILIHPSAVISKSSTIDDGTQIMMGACIQTGTKIGKNVIINTGATIDHDCKIHDNVFIAPGVTICGNVEIGKGSFIGAGSVIVPNTFLPANTFIKANTLCK